MRFALCGHTILRVPLPSDKLDLIPIGRCRMSPRDEMLRCMKNRAEGPLIAGQPVIPDGPVATTDDMQEFKRLAQALGYAVKFGQMAAVTKPGLKLVTLTASCTVGVSH